jgi:hypothetical protein
MQLELGRENPQLHDVKMKSPSGVGTPRGGRGGFAPDKGKYTISALSGQVTGQSVFIFSAGRCIDVVSSIRLDLVGRFAA